MVSWKTTYLGTSQQMIESIKYAFIVHDLGKIGVPTELLVRPGKINEIEYNLIKEHPKIGYNIIKRNDFPYPIAKIILQHHERLDGSGYPHKLKGEDILLEARIIAVSDVVEAMSSHRPYRPALGISVALDEIIKNKGILYDSQVIDICVELFRKKGLKFT